MPLRCPATYARSGGVKSRIERMTTAKETFTGSRALVPIAYFSLRTGAHFFGTMPEMPSGPNTVALRTALAEQIRLVRKKCGFSQEELAWRSGLHRTYISMVERAQRSVTIDSLERIATALGLSASALLARAERSRQQIGAPSK